MNFTNEIIWQFSGVAFVKAWRLELEIFFFFSFLLIERKKKIKRIVNKS